MLIAVDIGNSSISVGVFKPANRDCELLQKDKLSSYQEALEFTFKISSGVERSADEYAVIIREIFNMHGYDTKLIDGAIIASVVPTLTGILESAITKLYGIHAIIVGPGIKTGIIIKIDDHTQLGADIVANSVAALHIVTPPLIILDIGTATTFTLINSEGVLEGTAICPGVRTSLDALVHSAELLPFVSLDKNDHTSPPLMGKNSAESMRSGIINGQAFMISGFIEAIKEKHKVKLNVISTGGMADHVISAGYVGNNCKQPIKQCPELTLFGLYQIFKINWNPSSPDRRLRRHLQSQ